MHHGEMREDKRKKNVNLKQQQLDVIDIIEKDKEQDQDNVHIFMNINEYKRDQDRILKQHRQEKDLGNNNQEKKGTKKGTFVEGMNKDNVFCVNES